MPNKLKQCIEESISDSFDIVSNGVDGTTLGQYDALRKTQHHLLDVLVEILGCMDANDPPDVSYIQGYEKALDDVVALIKDAKV